MSTLWRYLRHPSESILYKEIEQQNEELSHKTPYSQPIRREYNKHYVGLFVIVAIATVTIAAVFSVKPSTPEGTLVPPEEIFPKFSRVQVPFHEDEAFLDTGRAGDKAWNDMIPLGGGYVRIPHPRDYDLKPSVLLEHKGVPDSQQSEIYGVSVIHQLHCLGMIRGTLIAYEKDVKLSNDSLRHLHHCLDYVRQGILCAGDTTLIPAAGEMVINGESSLTFTGEGGVHQCRDWSAVKKSLVERRVNDETPPIAGM